MAINYYGQYINADTEAEIITFNGKAGDVAYAVDTNIRYLCVSGTNWRPTDAVRILRGVANVDAKSLGNTKIYTFPSTIFRFVPIGVHAEYVTMSGTIGLAPTITVGTNATTYNNIATSSGLATLLSSLGLTSPSAFTIANNVAPLTASTDVYARVTGTATLYTSYTVRLDIFGYYEV